MVQALSPVAVYRSQAPMTHETGLGGDGELLPLTCQLPVGAVSGGLPYPGKALLPATALGISLYSRSGTGNAQDPNVSGLGEGLSVDNYVLHHGVLAAVVLERRGLILSIGRIFSATALYRSMPATLYFPAPPCPGGQRKGRVSGPECSGISR